MGRTQGIKLPRIMHQIIVVSLLVLAVSVVDIEAHGRLMEPASRASAFRLGFGTPPNYNDNQAFCGGFTHQWYRNGGKCGICGDPFDGIKHHEAGGKYATGRILTTYMEGNSWGVDFDSGKGCRG